MLLHASPATLTQFAQHAQASHTQTTAMHEAGGMMEEKPPCGLGDIACYCDRLATFLTEQAWNALKPFVDASMLSPASVVVQTPPQATYENAQVQQMVTWELGAIDSALALLVGFLSYNLIVGRSIGMNVPTFQEALPRLLVAFVAAHLCLYVCRLLIDFNNALAIGVYEMFLKTYLKDTISTMIHFVGTSDTTGAFIGYLLRAWIVMYIFVQLLWIFWQMLVRLALIALLTMLSPLGLMCLALPQTQRWGRYGSPPLSVRSSCNSSSLPPSRWVACSSVIAPVPFPR
ncbi:hypothetical protein KSX_67570 [Ktedonospora formicarum]|uniref:Uncharacterized protein n=2 Tax=Ktedonospora formicarum TaxID=2778364 RepID=A0A8J3IBZ8_9CHLR|nr:hypothetical protein KSX_67570 [Ktedonospora formicarum]